MHSPVIRVNSPKRKKAKLNLDRDNNYSKLSFSFDLQREINNAINTSSSNNLELEIRFQQKVDNKFLSSVDFRDFNRLSKYMRANFKPSEVFDDTVESMNYTYDNGSRSTIRKTTSSTNSSVKWENKFSLKRWNINDYHLRISLSDEQKINEYSGFDPDFLRKRNRIRYLLYDFYLELSTVYSSDPRSNLEENVTYEVEIEIPDSSKFDYDRLALAITFVYRTMYGTKLIYNMYERNQVIKDFNYLLNIRIDNPRIQKVCQSPQTSNCIQKESKKFVMGSQALANARDLKIRDLVWGGLVGNPKTSFRVTHKADGMRKLLLILKSGIWIVMPPDEIMWVYPNYITSGELVENSIFEGELLSDEDINNMDHPDGIPDILMMLFDCLAYGGSNSIQLKTHQERMSRAQEISDIIKAVNWNREKPILSLLTKSFHIFQSPSDFYKVMEHMFARQGYIFDSNLNRLIFRPDAVQKPYKTDGFMFVPYQGPYNTRSNKIPLRNRSLLNVIDICKWKPSQFQTIDFTIMKDGNSIQLYSFDKGCMTPFLGSLYNSFNTNNVDISSDLTKKLPSCSVVEYQWNDKTELMVPLRERDDKKYPNSIDVAIDVWDIIHNPILPETMIGSGFTQVFKYHNRVKRNLYNNNVQLLEESGHSNLTLLDIGSGRGGDVDKWKKFSRVLAVEPDFDNEYIEDLYDRIKLNNMEDKVNVLRVGGEETDKILDEMIRWIGDQVDVISFMFSMSFFWKDSNTFNSMISTIDKCLKPGGKVIFATINGDAVEQMFNPTFGFIKYREISIGPSTIRYDNTTRRVYINIVGSRTVQDINEYIVNLGDLKRELISLNYTLDSISRLDEERFLNYEERYYTKLFSAGSYTKSLLGTQLENKINKPKMNVIKDIPSPSRGLKSLDILYTDNTDPSGLLMDKIEFLKVLWTKESVLRISTTADGTCFFHSVLKSFYRPYQESFDHRVLRKYALDFRHVLAEALNHIDPDDKDHRIYYYTVNNGYLYELYTATGGLEIEASNGELYNYSLEGMQKLLRSNACVGDEVMKIVSEILGLTLIILELFTNDLNVLTIYESRNTGDSERFIIIGNTSGHYETIGVRINIGNVSRIQTIFDRNDKIIQDIMVEYNRKRKF